MIRVTKSNPAGSTLNPAEDDASARDNSLKTHELKCSALSIQTTKLPYYNHNCNIIPLNCNDGLTTTGNNLPLSDNTAHDTTLNDSDKVDVHELSSRLEALYLQYAPDFLDDDFLEEDSDLAKSDLALKPELHNSNNTTPSQKHRSQEEAIVRCMHEQGLLDGGRAVYVEFGSGKGNLSLAIGSSEYTNVADSRFICIEKSAYKHKAENNARMEAYRARIDLCDVDLPKLLVHADSSVFKNASVSNQNDTMTQEDVDNATVTCRGSSRSRSWGVVGTGKHVCGGATDLSLVALKNLLDASAASDYEQTKLPLDIIGDSTTNNYSIKGVSLALCCHGLCSWNCCTAKSWLQATGNITTSEFEYLRKWSGFFVVDKQQAESEKLHGTDDTKDLLSSFSSRARLGRMCKRLIDFGRMHYIRTQLHLQSRLVRFIDSSVTPENVLLIAYQ
jgi:tRNA:m4X modification enzyme